MTGIDRAPLSFLGLAWDVARASLLFFAGLALCIAATVFAAPILVELLETALGTPLDVQGAARCYIGLGLLLLVALAWLAIPRDADRRSLVAWLCGLAAGAAVLAVIVLDQETPLHAEESAIRWVTFATLVAASLASFAVAIGLAREGGLGRKIVGVWALMAGGFLFGGLDEAFTIHELLGRSAQDSLHVGNWLSDLLTMAYALGALAVMLIIFRWLLLEHGRERLFLVLLLLGGVVFLGSQLVDSVDVIVFRGLVRTAAASAADPGAVFSPAWTMLYVPYDFSNGWEEVLEQTAATLFLASVLVLALGRGALKPWADEPIGGRADGPPPRWPLVLLLLAALGVLSWLSWTRVLSAPMVDSAGGAQRLVGRPAGLERAAYLALGQDGDLLAADAATGAVARWADGNWRTFAAGEGGPRKIAGLAVDEGGVYVSDEQDAAIFRWVNPGGWKVFIPAGPQLGRPGALALGRQELYVLDTAAPRISRFDLRSRIPTGVWDLGAHGVAPDSLVWDRTNARFFLASSRGGEVWAAAWNSAPAVIGRFARPTSLCLAPKGELLVTDSLFRGLRVLTASGNWRTLCRFSRMYAAVDRAVVDPAGDVFILIGDRDRCAFIPPDVYRIEKAIEVED